MANKIQKMNRNVPIASIESFCTNGEIFFYDFIGFDVIDKGYRERKKETKLNWLLVGSYILVRSYGNLFSIS